MIKIDNLSKKYGDLVAVNQVNLNIKEREIFGLLGPNGAGKSSLISMLFSLQDSDGGTIRIDGLSLEKDKRAIQDRMGLVPQDIALYPSLSALENLSFWGKMYGLRSNQLKSRIDYVLEVAGLESKAKERVETYSGGMKRRLNIAVAMLHHPKILVLDEPTVGIDPQSRNHIMESIRIMNREGMTIIYTTHYMEEVESLCSMIAIMDHGNIIAQGTKEELYLLSRDSDSLIIEAKNFNRELEGQISLLPAVESLLVNGDELIVHGKIVPEDLNYIITILSRGNCSINSITRKNISLESVFLHLTGQSLRD